MRGILFILGMLFCFPAFSQQFTTTVQSDPQTKVKVEEFHERSGLPNIFHKISTQRQIRIGYIGGSITEAEHGWRDLTFSWFQLSFPQTAFYQIDAGIGGSASDLGVFRMEHDILAGKPDLLFVEFAVNDHDENLSKACIIRSMEGIVRKTWKLFPHTDICFIYTTSENICKDLVDRGKINYAVEAMEEVADHYGIPSINLGVEIAQLYSKGKLVLSGKPEDNAKTIVFTQDHTHPLVASGYPLYASVVVNDLKKMHRVKTKPTTHQLGPPYDPLNWENAKMLSLKDIHLTGDWTQLKEDTFLKQRFGRFMPSIYKAKPGATMDFSFEGSVLGIYDCIGPGTGILDIAVDGIRRQVYRFDTYCYYYRKSYFILDSLGSGTHQVEITVANQTLDKQKILSTHLSHMGDPAAYRENAWYPANIMIIGQTLP